MKTPDAGRVSVFLAIGLLAVSAVIGLSVDGAGRLLTEQRAHTVAAEAARTGGQAIDEGAAIDGERKVLDQVRVKAEVAAYVEAAGAELVGEPQLGTSSGGQPGEERQTVAVTVALEYEPVMLGLFGMEPSRHVATVRAELLDGPP
ncbi:hypothetical protein [Plantactinospora sp. GCM10030261]|uniref:hypothetical protein n=1 Tax=Plantactinospora sp. GCM10030261 TaxID=3273420 RepID=UPI0036201DEC